MWVGRKSRENVSPAPHDSRLNAHLPRARRDDDIFLVSFPKSGNTWVSFLIANTIVQELGLRLEVNHFNIHGFVPDIHQGRDIPLDMSFFPFKRVIKSHAVYNPDYKNVIYLIRDPRSVMVSYYHFLVGLGSFSGSLSQLIHDPEHGILSWVGHVNGWRNRVVPGTRFRVYRYEDIKGDTVAETSRLLRLLGVRPRPEAMKEIVRNSDFQHLRELERETGTFSIRKVDKDFKFVRDGKVKGWKGVISNEDERYIVDAAGECMTEYGYDL